MTETLMLAIIFWNFLMFQYWFGSSQVKRYLISSIKNIVHKLSHEVPNELSLTVLEK